MRQSIDVEKEKERLVSIANINGIRERFESNPNIDMKEGFEIYYKGLLDEFVWFYGPRELSEILEAMARNSKVVN